MISERYHGCILALKRGIPCIGVISAGDPKSKIAHLYRQLDIPELLVDLRRGVPRREALLARASEIDVGRIVGRLELMTARLRNQLSNWFGELQV